MNTNINFRKSCPMKTVCGNYLGSKALIEGIVLDACEEPELYRECGEYQKLLTDKEYHQKMKEEVA